jgi:hypothetical protein
MKPIVSSSFVRALHDAKFDRSGSTSDRRTQTVTSRSPVITSRRLIVATVVVTIIVGSFVAAEKPAWARSDPKHVPVDFAPTRIARSVCGFRIHLAFPVNRVFAKATTLDDGTEVWRVTGSLVVALSSRHVTLTQNASGPATFIYARNGGHTFDGRGLSIIALTRRQQADTGMGWRCTADAPSFGSDGMDTRSCSGRMGMSSPCAMRSPER